MAPNKHASASKAASKAAKKVKQAEKAAKKEVQAFNAAGKKGKGRLADEEEDLEAILERYQREMAANTMTTMTTLDGPPPPRTGALFLPSPSTLASEPAGNHLYLLFGEYFDGSRATFYNSTLRYDITKDEWREYRSPEMPAPRSSAAGVYASNLGEGGGILIFGGEYASPTQTSFHHYKDLVRTSFGWLFSIKTHLWERIDTRKGPSARSGHRMVMWRQYVILFGGFIDTGIKTNYLADLWLFDTEEYKWKQVDILDKDRTPGPRSGFSFIPTPEGAILHGGYRKEYVKGTRPKGIPLEDTWLLRMDTDVTKIKWEKRKKVGYAPSLRSGCTMAYWANKGMGVLFGGVLDEEKDEESMESVFYNDLYGYNPSGNGRWVSLNLKKRKKTTRRRVKKEAPVEELMDVEEDEAEVDESDEAEVDQSDEAVPIESHPTPPITKNLRSSEPDHEDEDDDPSRSVPLTRYNAMLAIVKNTLFIYGGIYETLEPAREYTLDDFVTLNLEKLDQYIHIRGTGLDELEWRGSSDEEGDSSDEGGSDSGESDEEDDGSMEVDEEEGEEDKEKRHAALSQAEKEALRRSANRFLGVAKDTTRSEEDVLSTPLPGEKLRQFFDRSREYWSMKAYDRTGSRGKALRREGFDLASVKYAEYKPILEEIERIQKEAEAEGAMVKRGSGTVGEVGRNRR
ncbi:hypothetical protein TREMEDRAFT_72882 [Tremella mesenterica DSM 1558]|uniref:uncharacterized protein n=1 Tax=Tremella mesenterica (strain ATCC 24925 / CBS 8224 / DSM 1558 / NBRC 9311 / NRRL Y-6157 / RJB 2259-6 / UBC 559-6) TaxID=578456 RepID=UPI0003F49BA8|nr:uncharacterized protein TREMEDRAFT_72882 [Tremella mesenterica DSM 1558]EIW72802.1 hypothetical protein TREMEDRAFT_72882 [Tremella mesenterica DSM 1558]